MVDKVGLSACRRKPVEFLVDRFLGLVEEKEIQIFQVCSSYNKAPVVTVMHESFISTAPPLAGIVTLHFSEP